MDKMDDVKKECGEIKDKVTAEEYIEEFKKSFNLVNLFNKNENVNTNVLKELYYEFIIYNFKQSDSQQFILDKLTEIEEILTEKFTDTQKEQLKIYNYLQNEMADDEAFHSFLWGFSLANELNMSSNSYAKNDKILNELMQMYKQTNNKGGESNE